MKNFEREHSYICIFTSKEIKGEKLLFYSSTAFSGGGVGERLLSFYDKNHPPRLQIQLGFITGRQKSKCISLGGLMLAFPFPILK